ncbi:glycosyltransferase [Kocuria turfanensis]|uniref:glycosyltransferase n=1 Tax=Kocuria turfanensis TaxID=388357 RepID=UPI004036C4A6
MRVLVVSTWYPSAERPGETPFVPRHVRAIARHHDVRVLHVRLLRTGPAAQEEWDGVPVLRLPFHPLRPATVLRAWAAIGRHLAAADVLHTMPFSAALVCLPVARRRPWVHTEHWNGVLTPEQNGPLWRRLAWSRRILRLPDRVTGVSTMMCEVLRRFADPDRVERIGNVVDHAEHVTAPPRGRPLELLAVGALRAIKDPLLAVEAVAWLRDAGHDVRLTWCGAGELEQDVRDRARELGLEGRVLLAGTVGAEEVQRRLAASDVFLLPSRSETFCVAAAEALAAGRPVVMGAVGGQRDFVHPRNGRLVAERTPEAFGQAVLDVVGAHDLLPPEEMAHEIRSVYGSERIAADLDRLYRSVVPRPGAGRRL